ncbi:uncharacterized protein ACDP82_004052 [Pangshura tecta]
MLGNLLAESPGTDRLHYILENSAELPRLGHHVAQLALFIIDPAKDLSRQAREGVYRLYQLLLHQMGLRKVLLGGPERILPPDGSAGRPRPPAACQPGWAAPPRLLPPGGSPAAAGEQGPGMWYSLPDWLSLQLRHLQEQWGHITSSHQSKQCWVSERLRWKTPLPHGGRGSPETFSNMDSYEHFHSEAPAPRA